MSPGVEELGAAPSTIAARVSLRRGGLLLRGTAMEGVLELGDPKLLAGRLGYLAWRRFRIPREAAEDLVQAALLTFLEVRDRYPNAAEHPKILVGIFRNKCREYIENQTRAARGAKALRAAARTGSAPIPTVRPDPVSSNGVLAELVHREEGRLILQALAELRPKAREMFRLITEEGASRQDLIRRYRLNKNTLDSRLHAYRVEFRKALARRDLHI